MCVCVQGCADVCVLPRTQWDLLSGVCREQEDQQGQTRDEHAGDEQVEAVVKCPAAHGDCERNIRVWFFTAVVVQLITLSWHTLERNEEVERCQLWVRTQNYKIKVQSWVVLVGFNIKDLVNVQL